MLRGLWKLTWLEIKIFVREPLGFVGTIGIPVVVFVVARAGCSAAGRAAAAERPANSSASACRCSRRC